MSEQKYETSYRVDGKRIYTSQFKHELVAECNAGATPAEVARKYQIPM